MDINQEEITALVRQVVSRTLGQAGSRRPLVDEESVRRMPPDSTQAIPADALLTPLARQVALEKHINLVPETLDAPGDHFPVQVTKGGTDSNQRVVAMGADHGGYELKERLKPLLAELGYRVIDCGAHSTESVDYPDFAYAVGRQVADGRAWRGIIIDGAGIGSCMVANKVPGIRAAMCYDQATAVNSREHNNANVLTLGAGLIGLNLARQIVQTWLATEFAGGRHARRVDKIDAVDRRYTVRTRE